MQKRTAFLLYPGDKRMAPPLCPIWWLSWWHKKPITTSCETLPAEEQKKPTNQTGYANTALKCTQICNQYILTHTRPKTDTLVIIRLSFLKEISHFEHGFSVRQWESRSAFWLSVCSQGCVSRLAYRLVRFRWIYSSMPEHCSSAMLSKQSCSWSHQEPATTRTNENQATGHYL